MDQSSTVQKRSKTPLRHVNRPKVEEIFELSGDSPDSVSRNIHKKIKQKLDRSKYYKTEHSDPKTHNNKQPTISPYYQKTIDYIQEPEQSQSSTDMPTQRQTELLLKIGTLIKENVRITQKVSLYEQIFPKLIKQNEGLEKDVAIYQTKKKQMNEKIALMKNRIQNLQQKINGMENESEEAQRQLQSYKDENRKVSDSLITIQAKLTQLQIKNSKANRNIQTKDEEISELQTKINKLTKQIKTIEEQQKNQDKWCQELRSKLSDKNLLIQTNENELALLKKNNTQLLSQNKQLSEKIQQFQNNLNTLQAKHSSESAVLSQKYEQMCEKFHKLKKQTEFDKTKAIEKTNINVQYESVKEEYRKKEEDRKRKEEDKEKSNALTKVKKKNQELIKINKILEEELSKANQRILCLQRDHQDKVCEQYVGRLSRLKKSTYIHSVYGESYPLNALQNLQIRDQILDQYKTYKSSLYQPKPPGPPQNQSRSRINSHIPQKSVL